MDQQNSKDGDEHYFRILRQDFISGTRVDPYTGFAMQEYYSAVTEPYLVEEGYSTTMGSKKGEQISDYEGASPNGRQREATLQKSQSRLEVDEALRARRRVRSSRASTARGTRRMMLLLISLCAR